jgi:hypothetical protein
MTWSSLAPIAIRLCGLAVFTNALFVIVHASPILVLQLIALNTKELPSRDYLLLLQLLPTLLFAVTGSLFFFRANWIAFRLVGAESGAVEQADLRKLERVLIGVAGLYLIADGIAAIAQILQVTVLMAGQTSFWGHFIARYLGGRRGGRCEGHFGICFYSRTRRLSPPPPEG